MGEEKGGKYVEPGGEFTRDQRYIATRITADGRDGYPVEPGRYRLVVSRACPWANRLIIVRRLLGLEDALSMAVAGPTHDARSWTFDLDPDGRDPVLGIERMPGGVLRPLPRLRAGHHRAGDRGRADRAGGDQRLRADEPGPVHPVDARTTARARRELYPEHAAGRDRRGQRGGLPGRQQRRLPVRLRRQPGGVRQGVPPALRPAGLAHASGWPTSATWSATPSPRPTCGCSPRWSASTRSTTATSSATGRS